MTDTATIEALLERLEKVEGARRPNDPLAVGTNWYRNPDGPQAASTIRALSAENERMRTGLDAIAIGEGLPDVIAQQALKEADTARAIEKKS